MSAFWDGFEKQAVTAGWVAKRVNHAVANRSSLPKKVVQSIKNKADELYDRLRSGGQRFSHNDRARDFRGLRQEVNKINLKTVKNPAAAREFLEDGGLTGWKVEKLR